MFQGKGKASLGHSQQSSLHGVDWSHYGQTGIKVLEARQAEGTTGSWTKVKDLKFYLLCIVYLLLIKFNLMNY